MGSSQSRPNDDSKRHSRVGDQLKSVLRRPSPATRENNGEEVKPLSKGEEVTTNGKQQDKTPTPETEPTKPSTAAAVVCIAMFYLWLC